MQINNPHSILDDSRIRSPSFEGPVRKQNILFVAGQLNLVGGAENFLSSLMKHLKYNPNTLFAPKLLVLAGQSKLGDAISQSGIEVALLHQRLPLETLNQGDRFDVCHVLDTPEKAAKALGMAGAWSLVEGADMLVGLMTPACVSATHIAAALKERSGREIPVFWAQRDTDPTLYNSETLIEMSQGLSRGAATVICCSPSSKEVYQRLYPATVRCIDIFNGVDTEFFDYDPEKRACLRQRLGILADSPVIGMAARYSPMKNILGFISVAKALRNEIPNVHFLLCGSGMEESNQDLKAAVSQALEGHIHFLGVFNRSEMPDFYNACDVLFSPSLPGEAASNSLIESISCGTQIVVTDVGDSSAIAGHDPERVLPIPGQHINTADWTEKAKAALIRCLKKAADTHQANQLRSAVRSLAKQNFSDESCYLSYEGVFLHHIILLAIQALRLTAIGMPVLLPGKRTNHVFEVDSNQGKLFVKVYRTQGRDMIEDAARVQSVIPKTKLFPYFLGQYFIEGVLIEITREIPGTILERLSPEYVAEHLADLGRVVALFHQNTEGISLEGSRDLPRQGQPEDEEERTRWNRLPTGVIHCDINPSNVVYNPSLPDESVIIDLEAVREGVLLTDIARAIHEFSKDSKDQAHFLKGYESIRPLTQEEKAFLPHALNYIARDRIKKS